MDMETIVADNDKRLSVHEAVCAERYEGILDSFSKSSKRMERIEYLLYAVIVSIFFGRDFLVDFAKNFLVK
jgi:hypothetical protein